MVRSWKRQVDGRAGLAAADVFPGNGQPTSQEDEVRRLRREVDHLKQERDFLKKAVAYVAKESRCATPVSKRTATRFRWP